MSGSLPLAVLLVAQIVGGEFVYTVQRGDSLTSVGARFGVDVRVLAEANKLPPASLLKVQQQLKIDNRHLVPESIGAQLVVNVPQRMLFYLEAGQPALGFPVAAGRVSWKTPSGDYSVLLKEQNPTWDVPVSIQREMCATGKPVLTKVPPSPDNPLGEFWIGLSQPGLGIHGTNAPSSIYSLVTHGCIRLHPDDIRVIYSKVAAGTPVRIVYEPVLLALIGEAVFLEAHDDRYHKAPDALMTVMDRARAGGFSEMLDLRRVEQVLRMKDGIARNVTR